MKNISNLTSMESWRNCDLLYLPRKIFSANMIMIWFREKNLYIVYIEFGIKNFLNHF